MSDLKNHSDNYYFCSEIKANRYATLFGLSPRSCLVSFTGPTGIRHSVEVTADSLYEAAALGLSMLRKEDWSEPVAPGTQLEVQVREPATTHTVSVMQIRRWCDGVAVSPDEVLKRERVKAMLKP